MQKGEKQREPRAGGDTKQPMHPMAKNVQWNCKGLRVIHEEVRFLMNRHQPSYICLHELMLEKNKYNLGREYKFYATTPQVGEAIKKEITHKRLNVRTTIQVVALEVYLIGKEKKTVCSIYLPPTDQVTEEHKRDLLEQLPAPMILLGDFNTHNPLWGKLENEHKSEND